MRIARVEAAFDSRTARLTYERGLAQVRDLSGRSREFCIGHARYLAAAVAPDLLKTIPRGRYGPPDDSDMIGRIIFEHGHVQAAFEYIMNYEEPTAFPHRLTWLLVTRFDDESRRVALLRRAIEAWRAAPDARLIPQTVDFLHLFQASWQILPSREALAVAKEIVRVTLERPERETHAGYGEGITITSGRAHILFEILGPLRHLDELLAEQVIAGNDQLASAARRYPYGKESIYEEAKQRAGAACGEKRGTVMMSASRGFDYLRALMQASDDGEFGPPIEHALSSYLEDISPESPNEAPLEFWPSTCRFRGILYKAGKRLGDSARTYLERIPDRSIRMFAAIELAASLAELPEFEETYMNHRPMRKGQRS